MNDPKVFISFFIFGLLNNVLYVIILSAAIDLVGESTPKAIVLLADILPAFVFKLVSPFFIHKLPYKLRIYLLVALSCIGLLIISLITNINWRIFGITLASLSSGMGEITWLQLTHYYSPKISLGGFASGTGGAGIFGSFYYMFLTLILRIKSWKVLLLSSFIPFGFLIVFYSLLPPLQDDSIINYEPILENLDDNSIIIDEPIIYKSNDQFTSIINTIHQIKPLIIPYMIPLTTVYMSEYIINQGISPTLLFPLNKVPRWLFQSYRDMYVVYGFLYQFGVFISRSSINFNIRIKKLYLLSILQFLNVIILIFQSKNNWPFKSIWVLMLVIFYEGLLGGFSYINTFMSVSEEVHHDDREFSMGCVSISDSLGIVMAGCISWWLEPYLCHHQVKNGQDWCLG